MQNNESRIIFNLAYDRWPFGTVGRVPDYREGGREIEPQTGPTLRLLK